MKFKLIKEGLRGITVYGHEGVSTGDIIELGEFSEVALRKPNAWARVEIPKSQRMPLVMNRPAPPKVEKAPPKKKPVKKRGK